MDFSLRTRWHRRQNRLADCLESRRSSGKTVIDLTSSNPTECGIQYPQQTIIDAFSKPEIFRYQPDPRGLPSARTAVAEYYKQKSFFVDPSNIFLTASTSEAYSHVFKLLCNTNDAVLVPQPSYPLFEYLAQINDVHLDYYHLVYEQGWHIDIESMRHAITPSTKAIILVNPHNPTGMFLHTAEYSEIRNLAIQHHLALIVDEVFVDYFFKKDASFIQSLTGENEILTFTLNGISKLLGLPQMKLGWIVINGPPKVQHEAVARMEILSDTLLSVNTPVQVALPLLLSEAKIIHHEILQRVRSHDKTLRSLIQPSMPVSVLEQDGGWYGILKVPNIQSDEQWALDLLEKKGVYVFPGYFFDCNEEALLVISLLIEEQIFTPGIQTLLSFVQEECNR